ncbi:MAG: polysaccharide biosynthesis protein [Ruminococcaceae bacterium]|nr:polysaccharide biosynthesis protein [Oscillospiraceae bacterium]
MTNVKTFLNKLNNMSPAAKASFWFVVSNVVLKGVSFITTPIFTRLLDVEDYGISSVFITWESIIFIFATLSLAGGVYNVAMTKFEEDVDTLTSSLIGLTAVASTLVYLCCVVINFVFPTLFELNTGYLIFMWVQTFFNAATTFWLMRKRFTYDYKKVIAYTFSNAILSPTVAIIAVKLVDENKAYAKIIGSGIWGIILGAIITALLISKGKKLYHKKYWKYALKFNIPLLPHYLSQVLLNSSDKLMLNAFVGAASAGLYSIAHSITGIVSIITQSINSSLIPYTLQSIKNGTVKNLYKTILGCSVLVSTVCEMIILFAREGILIFATPKYMDAVWFVAPLAFSVQVSFITGLVGNIVFYYEKTKQMSAATMITAVLNIILNYAGIKLFGYVAVGYATLITSFFHFFAYYFIAKKYEKNLNQIVNIKLLLAIFLAFAFLMIYGLIFWNNLIMKISLLIAILILIIILKNKILVFLSTITKKDVDAVVE